MQQLTYVERGVVEWQEAEEPRLRRSKKSIVEPLAVATCDLDRAIVGGGTPFEGPFALGHEMIARVLDVGDEVGGAKPGETVAVPFQVSCGECEFCRRGLSSNCRV